MVFKKAKPEQSRLKVSMYGPPGSGKTYTTLLFAEGLAKVRKRRIAYVDTEHGTDFYAQPRPHDTAHPAAFDFDAIYTRSIAETVEAVESLDPKVHGIVVIDSMTHMWMACIEAYEGKMTSIDTIPMHAWGGIKKPYKKLMGLLMDGDFDVFILGRQKNVFGPGTKDGEITMVGVGMKAEGETQYEPHICFRMLAVQDKQDPTKSTYLLHGEKDRTSVTAGRTISNPTFENVIVPILPLLGSTQAKSDDEEARLDKDIALADKPKEEKRKKAAKLFDGFQKDISESETVAVLALIGDALKKKKRSLTEEQLTTLRMLFESKRAGLVDAAGVA